MPTPSPNVSSAGLIVCFSHMLRECHGGHRVLTQDPPARIQHYRRRLAHYRASFANGKAIPPLPSSASATVRALTDRERDLSHVLYQFEREIQGDEWWPETIPHSRDPPPSSRHDRPGRFLSSPQQRIPSRSHPHCHPSDSRPNLALGAFGSPPFQPRDARTPNIRHPRSPPAPSSISPVSWPAEFEICGIPEAGG